MYTDQDYFIDATTSKQLLSQLVGPQRFRIFNQEAGEHLEHQNYIGWSPEFLADYVSEELRKSMWQGRQPSIREYQKMVADSRRQCREYKFELPASNVRITLQRVNTIDEFEFAKVMLIDLFEFYLKDSASKMAPPIYGIVKGRKCYSEIQVTIILSGVLVQITFLKLSKNEKAVGI